MLRFHPKNILLPVDLTEGTPELIRYAAKLAQAYEAELTVMHAIVLPMYPQQYHFTMDAMTAAFENEKEKAQQLLDKMLDETVTGEKPRTLIVDGDPVPAIARVADQGYDLVVVGTHGRKGLPRLLVGSVAEGVLHQSKIPVITVRPSPQTDPQMHVPAPRIILCPVNFTEVAMRALEAAVDLARTFEAELYLLHVVEQTEMDHLHAIDDQMEAWIPSAFRNDCELRYRVLHGDAAEEVLQFAEEKKVDLLVIGAQHRRFRDTTVIGTTTERLIRYAPCPVLTVMERKPVAQRSRERVIQKPVPMGLER